MAKAMLESIQEKEGHESIKETKKNLTTFTQIIENVEKENQLIDEYI
jgi:hypothetical protein